MLARTAIPPESLQALNEGRENEKKARNKNNGAGEPRFMTAGIKLQFFSLRSLKTGFFVCLQLI
jgi:hypothetical protein